MPVSETIRMAAQVTSKRRPLAAATTTRPSVAERPPKYSPTTAPIRLRVVATLSPVRKNGSAFGISTWRVTAVGPAAYERISSRAEGSTWVRPRRTLIMIGK